MIRLVIFEEQTFFRFGMKNALEDKHDIRVTGEAYYERALFDVLAHTAADIVLLGINIPDDSSSIDIAHHIRHNYPDAKILAVANEDTSKTVQSLMDAGINGYIGKRQADCVELEKAIRTVAAGGEYIGKIDTNTHLRSSKVESTNGARYCEERNEAIQSPAYGLLQIIKL